MTQSPFHILFLIDELKTRGGTERHLFDLVGSLAERGFPVTVATLSEGEYSQEFKTLAGVTYRCLNVKRIYDLSGLRALLTLRRYLLEHRVGLIQTIHTASDLLGPLAAAATRSRIAVVSSRRDMGYTKKDSHVALQRQVNRRVHAILANSRAVQLSVHQREEVPLEKISVIHNGIHVERFTGCQEQKRAELARSCGIDPSKLYVGSVGNIRAVKGYRSMVELAALACRRYPELRFLHAGEGEEKEELEQLCRDYGISEQVSFLGKVEAIPEFLSLLDLYLQPSLTEGFSNAILEAMAAGLPVIATEVGGNPEMIEHGTTGFLVPPQDVDAMAAALDVLVADPEARSRIGAQARNKVLQDFSFSTMVQRYLGFYHSMRTGKEI